MKIAYIIAHKNFRDEEYFIPKEILEGVGIQVDTYSNQAGEARGSEGGEAMAASLEGIKVNDYEGVVLAGGQGAPKYLDNDEVYSLLNEFKQKSKLTAAICISPTILAKAGLLKDKKATVWSSNMNKSAIRTIEERGAEYIEKPVISDGKVVTANGPQSAKDFGKEVALSLKN